MSELLAGLVVTTPDLRWSWSNNNGITISRSLTRPGEPSRFFINAIPPPLLRRFLQRREMCVTEGERTMLPNRVWLQLRSISAVTLLLALSPIAMASYECVGAVSGTQISPTGIVMANSIAGITAPYLCSVNATTNGVSTDACKAIYAMMLTAESQGRSVVLWFNDDPNTCSTHASWSWLTGWYWGPMLNPTG